MAVVYIYGLVDPRNELTIENVRYVGKTKNNVWRRLCKHVQDSKIGIAPVHKWIRKIKLDNQRPVYIILEECDENTWKECERKYIALLRKTNELLNVKDGGEAEGNHYHPSIELYCYDENGEFKMKYPSMTEASNDVHVNISKISFALNQKINKSSANCYWFTSPQEKENIVFRKAAKRDIPILQYSLDGNFINKFNGQGEAEKITGVKSKLINKCLRMNGYDQAGGYVWFYENNLPKEIKKYKENRTRKPISQYDLSGNLIANYNSISEAAKILNITIGIIVTNLKHITKTCKGFIFTYNDEKPEIYIDKRKLYVKKVLKFNINGTLLDEYPSINEASKMNSTQQSSISGNLRGVNKTAGGFIWKYKNNN